MTLRRLLAASLALIAATLASVLWIDRPLARLLAEFGLGRAVFTSSPVTAPVMIVLAYAGLLLGLGFLITGRKLPKCVEAAMLAGTALLLGLWLTHELLKPLFGRSLPSHYLRTGRYGFHWFHGGMAFGSFPSGHSTQAAAMLSVFWMFYPRWRWLYALLMGLLALALMLGQWHYLGDIFAGTLVGCAAGAATMAIWRLARARRAGLQTRRQSGL
jgi:membrane-associated phospholipid phosphatase